MPTTPVTFDPAQGAMGKHIGMYEVHRAANVEFVMAAFIAITKAAREREIITTDDVMERMPDGLSTPNLKVLGPIMKAASKDGVIVKAERQPWVMCARASRHRAPMQPWRSLIYRGKA